MCMSGCLATALGDEVHELDERRPLLVGVVRPQRRVLPGGVHDAPQILEPGAAGITLVVERVALEVEEQVSVGRSRQQSQGLGGRCSEFVPHEASLPPCICFHCRAACR